MTVDDNQVNGYPVDLLAAYNAKAAHPLTEVDAWSPLLRRTVHPVSEVARVVSELAGPSHLGEQERITVAADGSGDTTSVQDAVDRSPVNSADRVGILIKPGRYYGRVDIDAQHSKLSFLGVSGDPADVIITNDNAAGTPKPGGGTWRTTGSASVTVSGAEFHASDVTFENGFDEAAHPEVSGHQAVAVKTRADQIVFEHCRFVGNEDTLYLDSPSATVRARVYLHKSWIEGDVDFIFGRATAVINESTIKALRRVGDWGGVIFTPSTAGDNPYGFLLTHSKVISDAPVGSYDLGQPWHAGGNATLDPKVLIRETWLPVQMHTEDPWTTMSGFDWNPGSNAEYHNDGPGAGVNANRPQLSDDEASLRTIADYLKGGDGWAPQIN